MGATDISIISSLVACQACTNCSTYHLVLPAVQVGWMTGPAHLLGPIIKAHQFVVFTVATNLQHAVAYGLDKEQQFYM